MSLANLLPESEIKPFIEHHFQRLPYSKSGASPICLRCGSWDSLIHLLQAPAADVMVVRQNARYAGPRPTGEEEARRLIDEGYTLLIRHAESHHEELQQLAEGFASDLAAPVNIHLYCTPAAKFGFAWHYDAEEVFIVQTTGVKEYFLRKNSVNPWPIEETLPHDMHYEREIMPLMKVTLAAGDWLYIPSGYWHYGIAKETAISLSIGTAPRTGVDIFNALKTGVIQSLLWRQRLPVVGKAAAISEEAIDERLRSITTDLLQDLQRIAAEPTFIESLRQQLRTVKSP